MEVLGSIYTEVSDRFQKGIIKSGISRCVKAEKHDLGVIMSNCITSVQKDNLTIENPEYRIRKLTPRECGRLMGVSDEDITKMTAVNSNTQLYKQFGNSIVVDIMCAMFENLNINQGGTV